jgi:glutamyl-Q tRNA(Asp) synthetase
MEAHHLPCPTRWLDRRLGGQQQDVQAHVGDFVLQRADGLWAYQLAVVVDDAWQGITHVVRGQDLADNTPRQRLLQIALGLPTVAYLHTPLVLSAQGDKLSKQTGAAAVDVATPEQAMQALSHAALALGLPPHTGPVHEALASWVASWVTAWHTLYGQPTNP